MNNKWFGFKLISSVILLVMATAYTFIHDTSASADLWLCVWCLCLVRFVDVLDEVGESKTKCGVKND